MGPDLIRLSAVTFHELRYKIEKRRASAAGLSSLGARAAVFKPLPFTAQAARRAATARVELERLGRPIGMLDVLAAGHALALGYVFVTDNAREFERVAGLRLANWLR